MTRVSLAAGGAALLAEALAAGLHDDIDRFKAAPGVARRERRSPAHVDRMVAGIGSGPAFDVFAASYTFRHLHAEHITDPDAGELLLQAGLFEAKQTSIGWILRVRDGMPLRLLSERLGPARRAELFGDSRPLRPGRRGVRHDLLAAETAFVIRDGLGWDGPMWGDRGPTPVRWIRPDATLLAPHTGARIFVEVSASSHADRLASKVARYHEYLLSENGSRAAVVFVDATRPTAGHSHTTTKRIIGDRVLEAPLDSHPISREWQLKLAVWNVRHVTDCLEVLTARRPETLRDFHAAGFTYRWMSAPHSDLFDLAAG